MPEPKDPKPSDDGKQAALPPTRATADCGRFRVQIGPKGEAPLNTLVLGRRFVFSC
jgi:hypothetical protein